jgi:hypothetical protein
MRLYGLVRSAFFQKRAHWRWLDLSHVLLYAGLTASLPIRSNSESADEPQLAGLSELEFGKLSPAELELVRAVQTGDLPENFTIRGVAPCV